MEEKNLKMKLKRARSSHVTIRQNSNQNTNKKGAVLKLDARDYQFRAECYMSI